MFLFPFFLGQIGYSEQGIHGTLKDVLDLL